VDIIHKPISLLNTTYKLLEQIYWHKYAMFNQQNKLFILTTKRFKTTIKNIKASITVYIIYKKAY